MQNTTILWQSWRTTCVSRQPQLRTGGFCWSKVVLPVCPGWWHLPLLLRKKTDSRNKNVMYCIDGGARKNVMKLVEKDNFPQSCQLWRRVIKSLLLRTKYERQRRHDFHIAHDKLATPVPLLWLQSRKHITTVYKLKQFWLNLTATNTIKSIQCNLWLWLSVKFCIVLNTK